MLDILILTVFAYLIFRIITKLFSNIEALFTPTPTIPAPSSAPSLEQKPIKDVASSFSKESSGNSSSQKRLSACVPCRSSHEKAEKPQANLLSEYAREERVNRRSEEEASALKRELEDAQAEIERLRQEIEGHKIEKAGYVQRIEEIIQHVMNSQTPPPPEIAPEQQNDAQFKVLGELTREIDHAHQQELQRLNNREQELLQQMRDQQQAAKREHEAQILHISQQLELTIQDNHAFRERQGILQQELALAQQELQELRAQNTQGSKQESPSPKKTFSSPVVSKVQQEKIEQLQSDLKILRESLQKKGDEFSELLIKQAKLEARLVEAQTETNDLKKKLKQLREESHIAENDKIETDIKLDAQVKSLVQQKEDMEAQIALLNESLFRQEQERNQLINYAKQELIAKHETEIQLLTKNLEKAEQGRKEAENKIGDIQSELEFAQSHLKSTLESERDLTAQLQAMKSPKKEKVSLQEVQGHSEYIRLKQKVEELESEIKNIRLQKLESKEPLPTGSKINYARTKVERPSSPTFQYEAKERTPPKVETSSSRSKDVVSTIFASGAEKTRSPTSQRYQTPLQKPVAQSSIMDGGLLSEGFLGETNILSSQQREFLIEQIHALKKIGVKRSRIIYRSLANNPRPLAEYTSNVPNVLVVVELSNKKILGAFTAVAFSRDLGNQQKRTSINKALLIDISLERVILNVVPSETIRYDEHALIWGKNEFVISSQEPRLLTCDLNCQNAIFPSNISTHEFIGSPGNSCPISQFEVYRVFLG